MAINSSGSTAKVQPQHGVRLLTVTEKNCEQRVDNFLIAVLKGVPKSKIYRIIRKGEVRINKKRCKPEVKLQVGDIVRVPPVYVDATSRSTKPSAQLSKRLKDAVLYEDAEVLAINKPTGLAVHGGSGINLGLIEALRANYPEHQFLELVHRLDRETSGVILLAKSRPALRHLHGLFRDDKINKVYHLSVYGRWPRHKRQVDAPLLRTESKSGERIVRVSPEGKPSRTLFRILKQDEQFTLMEAKPITGRTHQIRVHAAFSGFPIVGDEKYGSDMLSQYPGFEKVRLMLHARYIEFVLRDGRPIKIEAQYEERFVSSLAEMGLN